MQHQFKKKKKSRITLHIPTQCPRAHQQPICIQRQPIKYGSGRLASTQHPTAFAAMPTAYWWHISETAVTKSGCSTCCRNGICFPRKTCRTPVKMSAQSQPHTTSRSCTKRPKYAPTWPPRFTSYGTVRGQSKDYLRAGSPARKNRREN